MPNWLPSLNALKAFEAVSRHLNYQNAAAELHVTPAAVKQLVQKLEEALDVSLVERQGRHIGLTEAGSAGLAELQSAFNQLNASVGKMRQTQLRKSLTISAEPSFALAWLVKRIDLFKHKNPDVDVLIDTSLRIVDLEREPVDLAIRYAAPKDKNLTFYRLFDDETLAVCSPSLAASLTDLKDLETAPLIHFDEAGYEWMGVAYRDLFNWQSWLEIVGAGHVRPNKGLRFNDYNIAIQAAIAGQGVVLGSWPVVRDAIEAGVMVAPFEESARTEFGYDLAVPKSMGTNLDVEAFIDWIRAEAEISKSS
jgi:LysR family transcriptional regulator, glycine cleavage system transcriptional activator